MANIINNPWVENFHITSLLVNPLGRLGLYGLLNLLQETAWIHAEKMGFGMQDMEKQGLFWVLTRQSLQMKTWPRFGENIQIQTWLRAPEGAFVAREIAILTQSGDEIGLCSTSWLALDRHSKKILPAENLRPWDQIAHARSTGINPEKIPVTGTYEKIAKYRVRNSDLDINQHVNNTKYAQWILDAIPYDLHKSLKLNTYSVNFLAETHLGDEKVLFTAVLGWEKRT